MIKNRSFIFGLGTGLIAGALLLQVMISGGAAPLSKDELIKEAAKLNLTVTGPAVNNVPEASPPADSGDAPEGEAAASPSATHMTSPAPSSEAAASPSAAAVPSEPSSPSQPAGGEEQTKAPSAPAIPQPAGDGLISVFIPTGSTLTETAELLAKAGVIADKDKFMELAASRKVNTRIQYGRYSFADGESNNQIIDKLITVK